MTSSADAQGRRIFKQVSVLPIDLATCAVTPAYATVLGEAAAVCLEKNAHSSGVLLAVDGASQETFELTWEAITQAHESTYADLQDATELGAYGVALLVVRELTGKTVVERSAKGGGFDWWVGDEDPSGLPFQGKSRLEVSGILTDRGNTLESRLQQRNVRRIHQIPWDRRSLLWLNLENQKHRSRKNESYTISPP